MAKVPGSRRTQYSVVSVIFIAIIVLYFCSLFYAMANISISFHIDILIKTFIFHLANLCVVAKIEMHVKIDDMFVPCY